jgi:hypothetical protein
VARKVTSRPPGGLKITIAARGVGLLVEDEAIHIPPRTDGARRSGGARPAHPLQAEPEPWIGRTSARPAGSGIGAW